MAKLNIRTTGSYKAANRKLNIRTTGTAKTQNNGSALGYLGQRALIGAAGIFEGFGDFVAGSVYQLAGDREYAKYLHDNDVTGGWQKKLDASYNPSRGMQVAGDIASGVGQALPSVAIGVATGGTSLAAQAAGTVGLGMAYAGRGITSAVQKTGELGAKENVYGVLSGAAEGVTDMFLGGAQKAGKALWTVGKSAAKVSGTKIARNGLLKGIWSSASSEFAEEFLQEYLDTGLLRMTGVDSEASTSFGDALYSGLIGGITGGILGGATGSVNAMNNIRRGQSIRSRGLEGNLLATANYIRNDYLGKGANFDNIDSPALRTLSAAVDAYAKLDEKGDVNGARGAMLLGEIQAGTFAFETEVGIRSRMAQIMANPTEELAQYASMVQGQAVMVEDLRQNRDGVAEMLAVRNFTAELMTESNTEKRVNMIREKVASERYGNLRESASFADEVGTDGAAVYRMDDGRYVIVTADGAEGNEGKYRIGFSETADFDEDHVMIHDGLAGEAVTKTLAGLADGSLTYNNDSQWVEPAQAAKNAPASGEGIIGSQMSAEGANEAQRGENEANASMRRAARIKISETVDEALSQKGKLSAKYNQEKISVVPQNISDMVSSASDGKIDISNKTIAIHGDSTWHEYIRHNNQKIETGRKQVAMTAKTIKEAIAAIYDPDLVECVFADANNPTQQQSFAYAKKTSAGYYTVVETVGGKRNPNIVPVMILHITESKWNEWVGGGRTLGEMFYENDSELYAALDVDFNKRNRVIAAQFAFSKAIANTPHSPRSSTIISQNSEKSTDSGKKVSEDNGSKRSAVPKTREAKARKKKRAQEHQKQQKAKKKAERLAAEMASNLQAEREVTAERSGTDTKQVFSRGYSDAEANEARKLVKNFDLLQPAARRAIIELYRSGKASGASQTFMRHAANLIAYWRTGLWIIADDKIRDDGFFYVFDDGTRLITVKPAAEGRSITEAFMHELGHDVWERADKETRHELYGMAVSGVDKTKLREIRKRYQAELSERGETVTNELLYEEIFANLLGEYIGTEDFLSRFGGGDVSALTRIKKTLSVMKKRFTGKDKYLYRKADDLFRAFTKVMAGQAVTSMNRENVHVSGKKNALSRKSSNYDFAKPFYQQIEDYKSGAFPKRDSFLLGATPEVFQKIGFNALPMTINQQHVDYALNGTKNADHHIGKIILKYLPTALKNPVAIITSKTENSTSVVAILSISHNGKQINVPVYVDGVGIQNGIMIDSNAVTSVYARKNAITSLLKDAISDEAKGNIGLFYWDKKRAIALLSKEKVTMPNVLNALNDGYVHSIREKGSPVKPKLKNVTESQQFKRWFGDWGKNPKRASKIVNPDGTPKVVYHGSNAEFDVFDIKKIGSQTDAGVYGKGFYFSSHKKQAEQYGKVSEYYLALRNPLVLSDYKDVTELADLLDMSESNFSTSGGIIKPLYSRVDSFTSHVKTAGFDGIIVDYGTSDEIVVFDPLKIKSATDNIGTFDKTNTSTRRALPKKGNSSSMDEMLSAAYDRGMGINSQTTTETATKPKTKKPKTEAEIVHENDERRFAAERARLEEKAAREVRNAKQSAENVKKNAEKLRAADRERLEKQKAQEVNAVSRTTQKLNRQIDYLGDVVSRRKHTVGGNDAARVLENSALKGFVDFFAKRTAAYGVVNKSTREAVRGLLPWYTAENEVLTGNVLDQMLAGGDAKKGTVNVFGYYNAEVRTLMEEIANGEGNLTAYELAGLEKIIGAIANLYKSYGTVLVNGKRRDAEVLAREGYEEMRAAQKALVSDTDENGKFKGALKRFRLWMTQAYLYSAVTPEAVLRDIEGNTKGAVLSSLYRDVRLGEAEAKRVQATILQPVAEFFAEKENRKYRSTISRERRFEYRGEMLTAAQAVGLWETSKRAHAQDRLFDMEKGGFKVAVPNEATGKTVIRELKASKTDLDNLARQFTEQDKEYIAALEESFKRATKYKIETDSKVLGYTNAISGHYYPIATDETYFARDVTDIRDAMGYAQVVYNKSFNKNTVQGARAPLFVEDSLTVLNRHASGIGAYTGLYTPLQTFGRVYGTKFDPTGTTAKWGDSKKGVFVESVVGKTSLRGYINDTLWSKENKSSGTDLDDYLTKLFSDIQGIKGAQSGLDRLVAKLQGAAVTASFGLNLKVIATQLASYPAAYKNLDGDVLQRGVFMKPDMEAMDEYSRITFARSFDGIGAAEGGLEKISEVGRFATRGIDFMDRQVIGRLWNACQLQVEKDGGGSFGSRENLRAAGNLLDNLLLDTQTTSLKADASALGRDKNVIAKMLTMFKTESMKSFSNLYGSFSAYVDHRRYAEAGMEGYSEMLDGDKKAIGKTVTSFLLSNAWVAAVAVAFSRIRKAAQGEEEEEKLAVQLAKEMGGNVADLFPVVSEVTSYFMDGYDMEYMPIATINDALSTLAGVSVLADSEATTAERAKYIRQSIFTLGELLGAPTRNLGRIALTATSMVNSSSAYLLRDTYDTAPTYASDLDRALAEGNERLASAVLSAWFRRLKGGKASSAVSDEILRLYAMTDGEGKSIFSMPKNVPSSLDSKQSAAFSLVYSEADGEVAALISSKAYKALNDTAKAKAVKACYDIAWSRAAVSVGLESTGSAARMATAEGVDSSIMAAVAGFAVAHEGEGRKVHIVEYLTSLGLSREERNKYLAALGYKVS